MNYRKPLLLILLFVLSFLVGRLALHYFTRMLTIDEQMITFAQNYIQINTAQPNPNYTKALRLLSDYAQQDNFIYQEIALASGKTAAVITVKGSNETLPALMLNHHMDVVPAPNSDEWITPPFAGEIKNNVLIGRGAQDMKGIAAVHYFALKSVINSNFEPLRTVHIIAVPDEEIGGFTGTKELLETEAFKKLNIGYVLDEGHASGSPNILELKVTERKPVMIRITGTGALAHGSHLQCFNVVHELIDFLHEVSTIHKQQQERAHLQPAGLLTSYNITSLTAGCVQEQGCAGINIVPAQAVATVDIRVSPQEKKLYIKQKLKQLLQNYPHLACTIEAEAQEEPETHAYQSPFYRALERTIETFGLQAHPHYFEGATDLRYYLDRGILGIGITPFTIKDNIHGTNESVPIDQLIRAREIIEQFLIDFCC